MDEVKKIFDQPLYWYFCVAYVSQIVCMYEIKMVRCKDGGCRAVRRSDFLDRRFVKESKFSNF